MLFTTEVTSTDFSDLELSAFTLIEKTLSQRSVLKKHVESVHCFYSVDRVKCEMIQCFGAIGTVRGFSRKKGGGGGARGEG